MLNKLQINNFQSHSTTNLEFSPFLNVIVGSSDSGKTSVIRALNWIINNKPSGISFISHWADECSVKLFIDNSTIERVRNKKTKNYYKLNEIEFKAFGQDVPEDIKKLLNMADINSQYQMDGPFLVSQSGGEIARYINKIANIDIMDTALSKIDKKSRDTKRDIERIAKDKIELKEEIASFSYLGKLEKDIVELEKKAETADFLEKEIAGITDILNKRHQLIIEINHIEIKLKQESLVDELLLLCEEENKLYEEAHGIKANIHSCMSTKKLIEIATEEIKTAEEKYEKDFPSVCPLCEQEIKK